MFALLGLFPGSLVDPKGPSRTLVVPFMDSLGYPFGRNPWGTRLQDPLGSYRGLSNHLYYCYYNYYGL